MGISNWRYYLMKTACLISSIGLIIIACFFIYKAANDNKILRFSVESTTVKAYNLTPENKLYTVINLGVRATQKESSDDYYLLLGIIAEVRKGKHHLLAQKRIPGNFTVLGAGSEAILHIEVVGRRELESEIADEVRADAADGEGRVNLRMSTFLVMDDSRSHQKLHVTCEDVLLDFSRSTERLQNVDCHYTWVY